MGMFLAFHILPVDMHIAFEVKRSQKKCFLVSVLYGIMILLIILLQRFFKKCLTDMTKVLL